MFDSALIDCSLNASSVRTGKFLNFFRNLLKQIPLKRKVTNCYEFNNKKIQLEFVYLLFTQMKIYNVYKKVELQEKNELLPDVSACISLITFISSRNLLKKLKPN